MVRSSGVRIDFRPFDRNQVCSFRSEDTHDVWSQPDAVGTLTTVGVPTLEGHKRFTLRRRERRRRRLRHPVIPGCAEEEQQAGAAAVVPLLGVPPPL